MKNTIIISITILMLATIGAISNETTAQVICFDNDFNIVEDNNIEDLQNVANAFIDEGYKYVVMDCDSFEKTDYYTEYYSFLNNNAQLYLLTLCDNGLLQIFETEDTECIQTIETFSTLESNTTSYEIVSGSFSSILVSESSIDCGEYGSAMVVTKTSHLIEDNASYNYYAIIHDIKTAPSSNHYLSSITCNIAPINTYDYTYRHIHNYAPQGTDFSTTVTLSLANGFSGMDLNTEASLSWTREIPDITVIDHSGLNDISITFMIGSTATASSQTRTQTMGYFAVVDCTANPFHKGDYKGTASFDIDFYKKEQFLWIFPNVIHQTYALDLEINRTVPISITFDGDGSWCNEMFGGDPEYLEDSFTWVYCQGDYVTLPRSGFLKTGYTGIGYSTVRGASSVEYSFGQRIQIMENMTLYVVWVED